MLLIWVLYIKKPKRRKSQNLLGSPVCTFIKIYQSIAMPTTIEAEFEFFVKSLNFQSYGTPLTAIAARNAVRNLGCEKN